MDPLRSFLALLVIAAAALLGAVSLQRAMAATPALNDEHAPLAAAAPVLAPAGPRLARRVVLVLVDGLRARSAHGMPALDWLRARGAAGIARSGFPTISQPNYAAILTGVPPRASGVRTNDWVTAVPFDDLFTRARAAGLRAAYVTQLSTVVGQMVPAIERMVAAPAPGAIDGAVRDALAEGPDLLFVLHNAPDEAAHLHGAASPEYLAGQLEADRMLAALATTLDLERDAIVVIADHGHTDSGGHGGLEPEVVEVPIVLAGAGVKRGAAVAGATTADVAPTVAALLGLPAPGHALGRALVEALDVDGATARRILAADGVRAAALAPFLAGDARLAPAALLRASRAARALILLAAVALVAWIAAGRRLLVLEARTLALGAALVVLPALAGLLLVGRLTPSVISVAERLPGQIGAIAVVLVPSQVLAALWLGRRGRPLRRLARTTGVAVLALFAGAAVSGATWALADGTLAVTFFPPELMVAVPLAHASVLITSATAALLLLAELARVGLSGPRAGRLWRWLPGVEPQL